jgi:hypothetical protein
MENWIRGVLSDEQWEFLDREPLVALSIAENKSDDEVPDGVLAAWQRIVALSTRRRWAC